jgi:hypothetical protein
MPLYADNLGKRHHPSPGSPEAASEGKKSTPTPPNCAPRGHRCKRAAPATSRPTASTTSRPMMAEMVLNTE